MPYPFEKKLLIRHISRTYKTDDRDYSNIFSDFLYLLLVDEEIFIRSDYYLGFS